MTTIATTHRATARWVPYALVALSLLPAISGSLRLTGLAGGPSLMPVDARIDTSPLPVIVHIASVIPYSLLGAFQFSSGLRQRHPRRHRTAGRLLVPLALAVSLSGLWMTLAYAPKPGSGLLLFAIRLVVGTAMAASVVLGFAAIRHGDVPRHRAWMTRAYALALGAGTQAFTGAFGPALVGTSVLANDLTMGAAWAINLAVAEVVIRSGRPGRSRVPNADVTA
ncbi:MAG TPA: DUF2306 domain-containing protein [Propionicimonas sp.]|jgi:uncharacterized membrane protein|uniref:DUF2306 domain-containing protein n=1 Tax=Propionicimonas sp. TaxID=1955623 RepID=UPI002F400ECA